MATQSRDAHEVEMAELSLDAHRQAQRWKQLRSPKLAVSVSEQRCLLPGNCKLWLPLGSHGCAV
eukprot:1151186-Pelagomonas_calceolata.AAC.12